MKERSFIYAYVFTIALVFFGFTPGVFAQGTDFKGLLATIDQRSNFKSSDFSAVVEMTTDDPDKGRDSRTIRSFRRDLEDKFLMLALKPENLMGQGYLRMEDNLWFYDPESRKFTHSSMKESFQGTEAKNSDFGQWSLSEDYKVNGSSESKLGSHEVWILELEAVHNEVTYPHKKVWITKKDGLLLKSEDYSLTKRLLRTALYTSYKKVGTSFVADKFQFIDALVPGKKTSLNLSEISVAKIPDNVFTKSYVERVNR